MIRESNDNLAHACRAGIEAKSAEARRESGLDSNKYEGEM